VLQGKLIIEARFTSAGMYGQLQRGQMNMRKRVQNKRLLGTVSRLSAIRCYSLNIYCPGMRLVGPMQLILARKK
jgi:hypothetical protein